MDIKSGVVKRQSREHKTKIVVDMLCPHCKGEASVLVKILPEAPDGVELIKFKFKCKFCKMMGGDVIGAEKPFTAAQILCIIEQVSEHIWLTAKYIGPEATKRQLDKHKAKGGAIQ